MPATAPIPLHDSSSLHDRDPDDVYWSLRALALAPDAPVTKQAVRCLDASTLQGLGLPFDREGADSVAEKVVHEAVRRRLAVCERARGGRRWQGFVWQNVLHLGEMLGLTPTECEFLALAAAVQASPVLRDVLAMVSGRLVRGGFDLVARLLEQRIESVKRAFGGRGAFARCGLVEIHGVDQRDFEHVLALNDRVAKALLEPHETSSSLRSALLTVAPAPCLSLDDFAHALDDVSIARDLLRRAVETRATGVNILLFGPPGTGKTQLSRVLAESIGATLYEAGVRDDDGYAASRGERIGYLRLAHTMLSTGANAVVACDEFEDVFGADTHAPAFTQRAAGQKGFLNALIEESPVPTVWIGNDLADISDSLLRRFAFVIELRSPPPKVRERILARHLGDLPLDPKWLQRVALDARVSPAHVSRVARVMSLLGPSSPGALEQVATRVLDNSLEPRQPGARPAPSIENYDLACLTAECDLDVVLRRLSEVRAGRILLHGESGTGKSAFARHVADSLKMPLHAPSVSDLLSPFIGMNEKNMAEAFRAARSEGAILFLDEVDSFVTERKQAQHSWEVTGVNELLVQMESLEGILICATNLVENVDGAAFRRFDLKIRLRPLTAAQRARLFAATLARLEAEPSPVPPPVTAGWSAALDRLDGLTVGDFATVVRRARLVPLHSAAELLARLTEELRLRSNGNTRTSGFHV